MRINVLGPIEVVADGGVVPLTGHGQRALLAALAFDHGKIVPADELIGIIWGGNPPASARTKIQSPDRPAGDDARTRPRAGRPAARPVPAHP